MSVSPGYDNIRAARRRTRNTIVRNTLIGSKWTAVTALSREKHFVVKGWSNTTTDCDGTPDCVVLEAVTSGRERVIGWRSLRNATRWRQGWF